MAAEFVPESLMKALSVADAKAVTGKDEFKRSVVGNVEFKLDNKTEILPGATMSLGEMEIPAFPDNALNLSDFFFGTANDTLWSNTYGADANGNKRNMAMRITAFLTAGDAKRWNTLMKADFYIPAADITKKVGTKRDLPNVNAVMVALLLTFKKTDVVFLNPHDLRGAEQAVAAGQPKTPVWVWNLTEMARSIRLNLAKKTYIAFDSKDADAVPFVFFCRGNGVVNPKSKQQIETGVKNDRVNEGKCATPIICNTELTPGKWNANGISSLCYDKFGESIGYIAGQFKCLKSYNKLSGLSIRRLYLVFDEFSAYSMAMTASAFGYGIEKETSILAYNAGVMTPTELAPWDDKTGSFYQWQMDN